MRTRMFVRLTAVLLLTLVFSARSLTSTLAAAPANDDPWNALALGFPGSASGSTLEAGEGPDDWLGCGFGPSIWYSFVGTGAEIQVNTFGSDFDTMLSVFAGTPYDYAIACNDDFNGLNSAVEFFAESGVTYYFMVNGCCGSSGNVVISTAEPPPPPVPFSFELAIDTTTVNAKTGQVTIAGTVLCTTAGRFEIYLTAVQRAGRELIHSDGGWTGLDCDPSGPMRWSVRLTGSDGVFKGGAATMSGYAYGYGYEYESGSWSVTIDPSEVRLSGAR